MEEEYEKKTSVFAPLDGRLEPRYRAMLAKCGIHDLRGIGRVLSVKQSSSLVKGNATPLICDRRFGRTPPSEARVGPKPKVDWTDFVLCLELENGFRIVAGNSEDGQISGHLGLTYRDPKDMIEVYGYIYISDKCYFYSRKFASAKKRIVPTSLAERFSLKTGDSITLRICDKLVEVMDINGVSAITTPWTRGEFSSLPAVYPDKKVTLTGKTYCDAITRRHLVGKGQRALVRCDGKGVRVRFFREAARSLRASFAGDRLIGVSLECLSEEAREMEPLFDEYAALEFGSSAEETVRVSETSFGIALRACERGESAVLLFDSLDELYSAYRSVLGDEEAALRKVKQLLMSAKATEKVTFTLIALCSRDLADKLSAGASAVICLGEDGLNASDSFVIDSH